MLNRIFPSAVLTLALIGGASAARGELICAGESGALLTVGSNAANRLTLSRDGHEREMELERWGICFRCAGFPSLRLDLKSGDAVPLSVRVGSPARLCDKAAAASETSAPEKYCIDTTSIWIGSQQARHCRFPQGTTLRQLWTALTQTSPPEDVESWWNFPRY